MRPWIGSLRLTEFEREGVKKRLCIGFRDLRIFADVPGGNRHCGSDGEKGPMRESRFDDFAAIFPILFRCLQKDLRQLYIGTRSLAHLLDLFE